MRHHDLLRVHVFEAVAPHLGGRPLDGALQRVRPAQAVADAVCEPGEPSVGRVVRQRRADDARGALAVLLDLHARGRKLRRGLGRGARLAEELLLSRLRGRLLRGLLREGGDDDDGEREKKGREALHDAVCASVG